MFNVHYPFRNPMPRRRSTPVDPRDGWQDLGLGDPSTLWYARDQDPTLSTFVTRFGFPWSKNEQDGGTLSLDPIGWDVGLPTVKWTGGGTTVRLGLRCDAMAPGAVSAKFQYTVACPCYYAKTYVPAQQEFGYNGGANNNAYWSFWSQKTPSIIVQINGVNHILVLWTPTNTSNGSNGPENHRGLFVQTARINGSNTDVQLMCRTIDGTYVSNVRTITSNSVGSYTRFAQGYNPTTVTASANSSNLQMGGGVAWKGVAATAVQMTAILNKWETLYPLS